MPREYRTVYVADRRLYLNAEGRVCDAADPERRELLVAEGGRLPMERAIALGLAEREEIGPGLAEGDRVSVDHPLFAQVFAGDAREGGDGSPAAEEALAEEAAGVDSEGAGAIAGEAPGGESAPPTIPAPSAPVSAAAPVSPASGTNQEKRGHGKAR